jgi:hypothetical protein
MSCDDEARHYQTAYGLPEAGINEDQVQQRYRDWCNRLRALGSSARGSGHSGAQGGRLAENNCTSGRS